MIKSNKRIAYIDYLKFIGIFLIILGHLPITDNSLHKWIFSFHVPLFFFISGLLYKRKDNQKDYFISNFKQLILVIIPYFIINKIFTFIQDSIFYQDTVNLRNNVIRPLITSFLGKSEMGPMWFFISLFWIRIIYNFLFIHIKNKYNFLYILLISIIISYSIYLTNFKFNYYQITSAFIALPFYSIGVIVQKKGINNLLSTSSIRYFFPPLLITITYYILPFTSPINLNDLNIGNGFVYYYLISILGISLVTSIAIFFKSYNHYITTISQGTIFIVGTHMIFVQIFKFAYKYAFNITHTPPYMDTLSAIIISSLILAISYYLIRLALNSQKPLILFFIGRSLKTN